MFHANAYTNIKRVECGAVCELISLPSENNNLHHFFLDVALSLSDSDRSKLLGLGGTSVGEQDINTTPVLDLSPYVVGIIDGLQPTCSCITRTMT